MRKEDYEYDKLVITMLIICCSGIIILYYLSETNSNLSIAQIMEKDSGNYETKGYISKIYKINDTTYFTLSDSNSTIDAVIYRTRIELKNSDFITGICSVNIYKDKKRCIFRSELIDVISNTHE